jgi:hypothetical protein
MVYTCMQNFRVLKSVYICKQIFMYLSSYNFVQELLHKSEFGQAPCVEWFKMSPKKFSLSFLDTPTSFYEFWKFEKKFWNLIK